MGRQVISNDHCVTRYQVQLFDTPAISVTMDSVITIPPGQWSSVPVDFLNEIRPVTVHCNPFEHIRWTPSQIDIYGDQPTDYVITFEDEHGCIDVRTLHILIEKTNGIYLPNIFRPGSISGNSHWTTTIYPPYQLELARVYDRWGNLQYQSTQDIHWDGARNGKVCPFGMYVYQIHLRNTVSGEKKVFLGDLTLIR